MWVAILHLCLPAVVGEVQSQRENLSGLGERRKQKRPPPSPDSATNQTRQQHRPNTNEGKPMGRKKIVQQEQQTAPDGNPATSAPPQPAAVETKMDAVRAALAAGVTKPSE